MEEGLRWLVNWWLIPGGGFVLAVVRFVARRRSPGPSWDPWQPVRWSARVFTANRRLTYSQQGEEDLKREIGGLREDLNRALTDNERLRQEIARLVALPAGSTGSAGAKSRSRSNTRRSRR